MPSVLSLSLCLSLSLLKLGSNPTSVDSEVVGKDNVVKMKPGQKLHIVNQLYQYTIQFKVDTTANQGATKRPLEQTSEQRDRHREEPSMKAAKQHEKLSVSASQGEPKQGNVKEERKSVSARFIFIFLLPLIYISGDLTCALLKWFRTVLDIGAKV